jgi:hypothetical protein
MLKSVNGRAAATDLYLLLSYLDRYRLVNVPSEIMGKLYGEQRSFGRFSLTAAHGLIDRYFLEAQDYGLLLTRGNLGIIGRTFTLPAPLWRNLTRAPLSLSLPRRFRSQ